MKYLALLGFVPLLLGLCHWARVDKNAKEVMVALVIAVTIVGGIALGVWGLTEIF